jgi:hypothetical protein
VSENASLVYQQDIIAPTAVHHLVEFGDTDPARPGEFGYWYNFLDYVFEEDGQTVLARHYLDEPDVVSLPMTLAADDDFTLRVLVFLAMRYGVIKHLGSDGYGPIPPSLMATVRERVAIHVAASAV